MDGWEFAGRILVERVYLLLRIVLMATGRIVLTRYCSHLIEPMILAQEEYHR